jgi:hypothetical protein
MSVVSLMSILDILVLVSSLLAFLAIRDYQRRQGLPYPPGPRPLPLIGNLIDIPREFSWLTYTQLSRKYGMSYFASRVHWHLTDGMAGDIISFRAFGQVVVVLNSIEVNKDLLEKRPDIYSDRPLIPIFDMYVFSQTENSCMVSDEVQDGVVLEPRPWKLHRGMASGKQAAQP